MKWDGVTGGGVGCGQRGEFCRREQGPRAGLGRVRVMGGVRACWQGLSQAGAESEPGGGAGRCDHRPGSRGTRGVRLTEAQVPWLPQ